MLTPKFFLLTALIFGAATNHAAFAQEDKAIRTMWTGEGDGKSWNQGSNWSTGHPPTSGEVAEADGAEITVDGVSNEAGLLSFSRTILTIGEGAELHVGGSGNRISFLNNESEIIVRGKLLLNSALYFTKSNVTVEASGTIDRATPESLAFLQQNITLNVVGDQMQIINLLVLGCPTEMTMNFTFGPSGMNAIDTSLLEVGENSILTVDVSKYKPHTNGTSVALFTFKGELRGKFETVNVIGGSGKIEYNDADVTLSEIVVNP